MDSTNQTKDHSHVIFVVLDKRRALLKLLPRVNVAMNAHRECSLVWMANVNHVPEEPIEHKEYSQHVLVARQDAQHQRLELLQLRSVRCQFVPLEHTWMAQWTCASSAKKDSISQKANRLHAYHVRQITAQKQLLPPAELNVQTLVRHSQRDRPIVIQMPIVYWCLKLLTSSVNVNQVSMEPECTVSTFATDSVKIQANVSKTREFHRVDVGARLQVQGVWRDLNLRLLQLVSLAQWYLSYSLCY